MDLAAGKRDFRTPEYSQRTCFLFLFFPPLVAARNHVNRMCLAADIPLIESGTAGYLGQVTVIKKVTFSLETGKKKNISYQEETAITVFSNLVTVGSD